MSRRSWVAATLLLDALLFNLGYVGAFLLRFGGELPPFNFSAYLALAVPMTLLQLAVFASYDLYDPERLDTKWEVAARVAAAVSLGSLAVVFLTFFLRQFSFPRLVIVVAWVLAIVLVTAGRVGVARWLRIRWPARRVLVVGSGDIARRIADEVGSRSSLGYQVIDVVSDITRVASRVRSDAIDRVIVASPGGHRELVEELIRSGSGTVRVEVVPELYEIYVGRPEHSLIADIPLMDITGPPVSPTRQVAKRAFDIMLALLLLPLFAILLPFVVLAVKLGSPGRVFYVQERTGRGGRRFNIIKFRTMTTGAEAESGPVMSTGKDPRVTAVGRFLRATRIDELPQILNVLAGRMSFVGPRPERPHFVDRFLTEVPGYGERLRMTPGLTGLAQISGGYATSPENKLKYDLIYMRHQSLLLDLRIIMQTLRVVLRGSAE